MNETAMTFDEFRIFLADALGVEPAVLAPDTHFLGDLAIESLKMVELVLQVEKRTGKKVPSDAAWEIETVQDAYDVYLSRARSAT